MIAASTLSRFWRGVGWFGVALLLYLSLTPVPPEIHVGNGDKIGHALAYATLMFWWGQLVSGFSRRLLLGAALALLGIVLEFVQGWTGWRTFDTNDMLANAAGVALGWVLVALLPNLIGLAGRGGRRRD